MIPEEARKSMISETRRHLHEKLWSAVLQSDTYELDDGAISNELREDQNIINEEDTSSMMNGVVPLNLLQELDRRSSQSLTSSHQHHQHQQPHTAATTTVTHPQQQGQGAGELFTSASLGSVGSSNNNNANNSPEHLVVINHRIIPPSGSVGDRNRYSPHSSLTGSRGGGAHHHAAYGDEDDDDDSGSIPSHSSSPPIPANSPLQKAALRAGGGAGGTHSSMDSTTVGTGAAAAAESSLFRRRHPTASSQNLHGSQNSVTGNHHGDHHEPLPSTTTNTHPHTSYPQRNTTSNIDALEAELFGGN